MPNLPFTFIPTKDSNFKLFLEPEVKDLSFFGENIIASLIKQFVENQDFEVRSLLLSIIFKCFSIRKSLIKQIEKTQIITSIENSEAFV